MGLLSQSYFWFIDSGDGDISEEMVRSMSQKSDSKRLFTSDFMNVAQIRAIPFVDRAHCHDIQDDETQFFWLLNKCANRNESVISTV